LRNQLLFDDFARGFRGGAIDASSRACEQEQQASDCDSFRHPAGTIAEVAYNAAAMMDALLEAKNAVGDRTGQLDVALVLGSGLGAFADGLDGARPIPYEKIPHMPTSGVSGHAGNLVVGKKGGRRVAAMQGRPHLYEGWSPQEVVFGVRLMALLGARTLIITNAAGGIAPGLAPGDLMAIADQLNLTGTSSLLGPNDERLGERFVDQGAMLRANDPIVFACANPTPEIWPWEAKAAGAAIVATGRSDFPNQVNNSLCFPAIFRGILDVRASCITDEMCFAAAQALASCDEDLLDVDHILPRMDNMMIYPLQAAAVGMQAQAQGLAKVKLTYDQLLDRAQFMIASAQAATDVLMNENCIPPLPDD